MLAAGRASRSSDGGSGRTGRTARACTCCARRQCRRSPARATAPGDGRSRSSPPPGDIDVPSLDAPPAELERFFERTGPWQTRVEIGGRGYGGPYPFGEGGRVERFLEWSGEPRRVLELGSLEGGCSVQLAGAACVERLVCIEARAESVERARLLLRLHGVERKAELYVADLEEDDLISYGRFDGVFCAGILYHLTRPWEHVARMAAITDRVFVDTHVSETDHIVLAGYRGRMYGEFGYDDPMSGTAPHSFWPTEPELVRMFSEVGMRPTERIQAPPGPGSRVWLEFVRTAQARSGPAARAGLLEMHDQPAGPATAREQARHAGASAAHAEQRRRRPR